MVSLDAYKAWKDIFNENVSNVWQEEPLPTLKKLSMLLFSVKKEIKRLEDEVSQDVAKLRTDFYVGQKKGSTICQSVHVNRENKENIQVKQNAFGLSSQTQISKTIAIDSPEIFQNQEPPLSEVYDNESIVISEEDISEKNTNGSPEIKKKKRSIHSQKLFRKNLKNFSNTTMRKTSSKKEDKYEGSVADDNTSLYFFKELVRNSHKSDDVVEIIADESTDSVDRMSNLNSNLVLTPIRKDCEADSSIVQCTPVPLTAPKRKEKMVSILSKKRMKTNKSSTLTQMFLKDNSKICEDNITKKQKELSCYDSEETSLDAVGENKTTNLSSQMGLTRMVGYINLLETQKDEKKISNANRTDGITDAQEIADIVDSIRIEDFEDDGSLNSAIVDVDEDEEGNINAAQELNEFLAREQNVPRQEFAEAPVVRGKARQNLPGWACKECEKFYLKQNLNPSQMLALSKCSKHRGYYKPREDTLPGYWDMNLVTQETQNT